jgi:hypothetical protein
MPVKPPKDLKAERVKEERTVRTGVIVGSIILLLITLGTMYCANSFVKTLKDKNFATE